MALRRGFVRYAFSIQYHGSSFLGFAHLKEQENCVLKNGTDLRGYRSIEARLGEALGQMVGTTHYENIKVSSRTDRGVHALKNTCHVDILPSQKDGKLDIWKADVLLRGLNHYLSHQGAEAVVPSKENKHKGNESTVPVLLSDKERLLHRRAKRKRDQWSWHCPMNELRLLNVIQAPLTMKNLYSAIDKSQPSEVDWNVRFSASQRTYIYRILACNNTATKDWALPFEWDRSWRILAPKNNDANCDTDLTATLSDNKHKRTLDVDAMKEAASFLLGTHDFTSFRAAGCQRASPVVTMHDIQVVSQPYGEPLLWEGTGGLLGLGDKDASAPQPQLITVKIVGNSFLYHQVRNMVGALVAVGRGSLDPMEVKRILEAKDRTLAPPLAPAHGLFLANVKHDDIVL